MALINCPECGKQVSDTAKQCPNCGFTLKTKAETTKETASEVGTAIKKLLMKYGESIIPISLLLIGLVYLFFEFKGPLWYNYHTLITPFDEGLAFWLPFILTIILPMLIFFVSSSIRKNAEKGGLSIQRQSWITKLGGMLLIALYIVGFAFVSFACYYNYSDMKKELSKYTTSDGNSNRQWEYTSDSNMAGAKIHYAILFSEEDNNVGLKLTYDPDNYMGLQSFIAKDFDKLLEVFSLGATMERGISFQFDGGEIIHLTPYTTTSSKVYITSKQIVVKDECEDFERLMQKMKSSKMCQIEVVTSSGRKTYTFNVAGLSWPAF